MARDLSAHPESVEGRAGRPLFWSPITIPGRPRVLLLDATGNVEGWERQFAARLFQVLGRKGIGLAGEAPVEVSRPEEMAPTLSGREDFNCILLFGHGPHPLDSAQGRPSPLPEGEGVGSFWRFLTEQRGLSPKLLAVCTCEDPDLRTSQEILEAKSSFAKLAVAPLSPLSQRVAGLFFMKFFAELDLHSEAEGTVTGKMVWFSHAKAKVLLERRHYPGEVGVRC